LQTSLDGKNKLLISNLDETYQGGINEPMHLWYEFLEGYSPGFVKSILNYFEDVDNILDPFSGIGTTAIESVILNKQSYYCEINPVLQLLTEVKIKSLLLSKNEKEEYSKKIIELINNINEKIMFYDKDDELESNYFKTFQNSTYFSDSTFIEVLKLRKFIDDISYNDELLSKYLLISTLSSLIPSSYLIRSGDVRYRRKNEMKKIVPLLEGVKEKLNIISDDLLVIGKINKKPIFLCEDSKNISKINNIDIDFVLTSPPYINGTNYVRNTKVEMWFLKCLQNKEDLRRYREKMITSGINTVYASKRDKVPKIELLKDVIKEIKEKAYDRRIPQLVGNYFFELNQVFSGIYKHMNKNGTVVIDIGDSYFCETYIPVDKILIKLLENIGFNYQEEVILRDRYSNNGYKLKQTLLILKKNIEKEDITSNKTFNWSKWETFKQLPYKKKPYSKRNWGNKLHSLCSYGGKMKPSLAHFLVKTFCEPNDAILDPFAGVGTIPFEASLMGVKGYGFEISPSAGYVASAKISKPNLSEIIKILSDLDYYIKNGKVSEETLTKAKQFGFNGKLVEYYHPNTFEEIVKARNFFIKNSPKSASEHFVISCILHVLHGNRPYSLSRRSHPITPYAPSGKYIYKSLIEKTKEKINRSIILTYPENFVEGKIFFQDATSNWPVEIDNLKAIITSPPFYDSTRFYMSNWLRVWFAGWDSEDFDKKPNKFIDLKQKEGFDVYKPIFRQARERLNDNGVIVMHLGESKKCDMASELEKVASPWFEKVDLFKESVDDLEKHGIRDKGTVTKHQFLILQ